jgi:hypothetical protein
MAETESFTTAFHIRDGAKKMARVDALNAVRNWPEEWRLEPWGDDARSASGAMRERETEALAAASLTPGWRALPLSIQQQLAHKFGADADIQPDAIYGFLADLESRAKAGPP